MSKSWPAKDPDAVLDYIYRIPLDAGDSVSSLTPWVTKLSGSVAIASQSLAGAPDTTTDGYGQNVTVWLSGGTDGETAVLKVEWSTAQSRTNDDIITIPIASSHVPDLVLSGYVKPVPGNLVARYPAFASVPTNTVQSWLTDAERYVTDVWSEGDYPIGLMALAAHNMALAGLGADAAAFSGVPVGITSMKSGSLSLNFTPQAANARLVGDLTATRYGQEYSALLQRNRGGPRVADSGIPPFGVYPVGWPVGWP